MGGGSDVRVGAVLFDMDGTLTKPFLDYDAIRREIGLPTEPRLPILESLEKMGLAERARAEAIVLGHEDAAAEGSELQEGAREVVAAIRRAGIPVGLTTRNSRRSVEMVIAKHGLAFDLVRSREDGAIKPSAEPVLQMCAYFGVRPVSAWMVGDYHFDILSGNAAGATTVLMIGDGAVPAYAGEADHVIRRLVELLPLLGIGASGVP